MNPVYDFKGQVALVTGAAKGMGPKVRGWPRHALLPQMVRR